MKKISSLLVIAAVLLIVTGCSSDIDFPAEDSRISIAAVPGVTPPAMGAPKVSEITETSQYTGTVSWSPADNTYKSSTVYTASITLTPKSGYSLKDIGADFFTVTGAESVTNGAGSGIVTAVFPATEPAAGDTKSYSGSGAGFTMGYLPGGVTFPTGSTDSTDSSVPDSFWLGETEVTFQLWYTVYTWAEGKNYFIGNPGRPGHDGVIMAELESQEPVTMINWRDAVVWCNALTEWCNEQYGTSYTCVYTYDDGSGPQVIRDSRDTNSTACDGASADSAADGFRLLSGDEHEYASRYISDKNGDGDILDIGEAYPGDHASGADADYDDLAGAVDYDGDGDIEYSSDVAVFNTAVSAPVKSKSSNALGFYDMSGNAWECCFTPFGSGNNRMVRGGDWLHASSAVQVSFISGQLAYNELYYVGFRFARTAGES